LHSLDLTEFFHLLILGVEFYYFTRLHSPTHTYLVVLLWTRDRSVADISTYTTQHSQETNILPLVGFESAILP